MPTYEYACGKCEREFEVEQRITDDPIKTCPHCRSRKVKRLISQTSFVLKGGGWYADAYSSKESSKSSDETPSSDSDGKDASPDAKTEKKSESTPDKKSPDKPPGKSKTKSKSTKAA